MQGFCHSSKRALPLRPNCEQFSRRIKRASQCSSKISSSIDGITERRSLKQAQPMPSLDLPLMRLRKQKDGCETTHAIVILRRTSICQCKAMLHNIAQHLAFDHCRFINHTRWHFFVLRTEPNRSCKCTNSSTIRSHNDTFNQIGIHKSLIAPSLSNWIQSFCIADQPY